MNDPHIHIRLANTDDLAEVEICANQAYAKYINRMNQIPAPMTADFAQQIKLAQVHVAHYQSDFFGFIVFYSKAEALHVENVAVLPAFAGKGIGKQLVQYAEQSARDIGLNTVELYTNEAMTENISMYLRLGYVETERKIEAGFSRVFFRKTL